MMFNPIVNLLDPNKIDQKYLFITFWMYQMTFLFKDLR